MSLAKRDQPAGISQTHNGRGLLFHFKSFYPEGKGGGYNQNLKLINVPVLKHHDTGGSEITASLKHFYGVVSMSDGQSGFRHYSGLGQTCEKMVVSVRTPVLNIIDAIWVSHGSISGYPESATRRVNQILASQDPVALDYWAAKYILYPIDHNSRHHPGFSGIDKWLTDACTIINDRGGLYDGDAGILANTATKNETEMRVHTEGDIVTLIEPNGGNVIPSEVILVVSPMGSLLKCFRKASLNPLKTLLIPL